MALTNQQLQDRILELESTVNDLQTAMNNLVNRKTLIEYVFLRQSEIEALNLDVKPGQDLANDGLLAKMTQAQLSIANHEARIVALEP